MLSDVALVTVDYGDPCLVADLAASVSRGPRPGLFVVVNTTQREPGCAADRILRVENNPGYSEAANAGLRVALEAGYAYIFLCNNDVLLEPETLGCLRTALQNSADLAAVSSIITFYPRIDMNWYAGGSLWGSLVVPRHPGIYRPVAPWEGVKPVEFVSGCALLFPRWALEKVGLLPEGYFMYLEDVEWSLRARQAGLALGVLGRPLIHHRASASAGRGRKRSLSALAARYYARNAWILQTRLNLGPAFWIGQLLIQMPYYVGTALVERQWKTAWAYLSGLGEGLMKSVRA